MSKVSTKDFYECYVRNRPRNERFFLSEHSFSSLMEWGAKKLAAIDGTKVKCMIFYIEMGDYSVVIGEYGKEKKLKGKRPRNENVVTRQEPEQGLVESKVRFFKSVKQMDFKGVTWERIETDRFLVFSIRNPGKGNQTIARFWKNTFKGVLCTTLISIDISDSLKNMEGWKPILLQVLLQINQHLLGEALLICDDVLPGYEKECHDYSIIYRSHRVPFFFC